MIPKHQARIIIQCLKPTILITVLFVCSTAHATCQSRNPLLSHVPCSSPSQRFSYFLPCSHHPAFTSKNSIYKRWFDANRVSSYRVRSPFTGFWTYNLIPWDKMSNNFNRWNLVSNFFVTQSENRLWHKTIHIIFIYYCYYYWVTINSTADILSAQLNLIGKQRRYAVDLYTRSPPTITSIPPPKEQQDIA